MKKVSIVILAVVFLFSCGKDKKEEKEPGLFDIIEDVSDLSKMAEEAEKIEEESQELINATPISNEELKALLPNNLIDYPRKKFSIGNQFMPDMIMAEAEYENEDGKIISFSVIDGAGETGSAMVTLARLGFSRDFEEQSDRGYKKSTTINGYSAIEKIEKNDYDDSEDSKIELLISNRFIITLEGEKTSLKQLKSAVNQLNLKALEHKAG
ncbi:hypothetical protein [Aquimarina sediminis]|uniref:hypothetical protein n=1 Tax=Aquimarina sediminis TaxID=2070536 RepID=UPI000CA04F27|nr:hypothetical protein [Aquimarina sediminis]